MTFCNRPPAADQAFPQLHTLKLDETIWTLSLSRKRSRTIVAWTSDKDPNMARKRLSPAFYRVSAFRSRARSGSSGTSATSHPPPRA